MIGSHGTKATLDIYEATLPNHHHPHSHTANEHSHSFTQTIMGYDPDHDSDHMCHFGTNQLCGNKQFHDTTSKAAVTVNSQSTLSVGKIEKHTHNTATIGDLYPRHMRVEYIFKCF